MYTRNKLSKMNLEELSLIVTELDCNVGKGATKVEIIDKILEHEPGIVDAITAHKTKLESDEPSFSKAWLLRSATYSHKRDILRVILKDDVKYSHHEVIAMMKEFLNREVR